MRPTDRWLAFLLVIILAVAVSKHAPAADPQPYTVKLQPTGDSALDAALQGSSTLISLQKSAPVAGFALTERARQDADRFATALHSFGYYKATISTTIGGHKLDDPSLPRMVDDEKTAIALAIAASLASGIKSNFGTYVKPLHVGHCGHRSPPSRCRFRLWRFSAQKAR